jgi:hypothetical protein
VHKIFFARKLEAVQHLSCLAVIQKWRTAELEKAGVVLTPVAVVCFIVNGNTAVEAYVPCNKGHILGTLCAKAISGVCHKFLSAKVASDVLGEDGVFYHRGHPFEKGSRLVSFVCATHL